MATKSEGTDKQNGTSRILKAGKTTAGGDSKRGTSKRTMKYNQGVRDVKS